MVHMMARGYVMPVLHFILSNTSELDQALLRNFISLVMFRVAPPYSHSFVVELTKLITTPKVQHSLRTSPVETKKKLQAFVKYCKKSKDVLASEVLRVLCEAHEVI